MEFSLKQLGAVLLATLAIIAAIAFYNTSVKSTMEQNVQNKINEIGN